MLDSKLAKHGLAISAIGQCTRKEQISIRDFLNKQYPPNLVDFIKDLEWEDPLSDLYRTSVNNDFYYFRIAKTVGEKYRVGLSIANFKGKGFIEATFDTLEQAKKWANEQYKEKLKEVLGL